MEPAGPPRRHKAITNADGVNPPAPFTAVAMCGARSGGGLNAL